MVRIRIYGGLVEHSTIDGWHTYDKCLDCETCNPSWKDIVMPIVVELHRFGAKQ